MTELCCIPLYIVLRLLKDLMCLVTAEAAETCHFFFDEDKLVCCVCDLALAALTLSAISSEATW